MLYDPKWGISLDSFISWLGTKNPETQYDFMAAGGNCLLGQYMAAKGIAWESGTTPSNFRLTAIAVFKGRPLKVLSDRPWTFGAALERAKSFDDKQTLE